MCFKGREKNADWHDCAMPGMHNPVVWKASYLARTEKAVVKQRLRISSAGVLRRFQNIPSSSLPETDGQGRSCGSAECVSPRTGIIPSLSFTNPAARIPSSFLSHSSHSQLALFSRLSA